MTRPPREAFIQHEFDEAIAVQRAIVEAERCGATGKAGELANALQELSSTVTESAEEELSTLLAELAVQIVTGKEPAAASKEDPPSQPLLPPPVPLGAPAALHASYSSQAIASTSNRLVVSTS